MTPSVNTLDTCRTILPAVDPVALTGADRLAVIDLLAASFGAAGID
jgi:hypothetical protein